MSRIMVVDDESVVLGMIIMLIKRLGHEPITARKGEQAVTVFRKERPHVLILDMGLPDMNGIAVLKRIREFHPETPVIILTGQGEEELEREARTYGVADFILKGSSLAPLKEALERVLKERAR